MFFRLNDQIRGSDQDKFVHGTKILRKENSLRNSHVFDLTSWGTILIHPSGIVSKEDMIDLVDLALEGRRRVKEQLKKMGAFEYHQTSFSYLDRETHEERYVGVPEEGGRDLIAVDPLAPGSVYSDYIGWRLDVRPVREN